MRAESTAEGYTKQSDFRRDHRRAGLCRTSLYGATSGRNAGMTSNATGDCSPDIRRVW